MIADSTRRLDRRKGAADYAHDVEVLAKAGYLKYVDVTLLSNGVEMKAVRFNVDTDAGSLTTNRPGGVLWPKVANAISSHHARLYRGLIPMRRGKP